MILSDKHTQHLTDHCIEVNGFMPSLLQLELIKLLEKNGPMTRRDLAQAVHYPWSTVYDNLMRLSHFNMVKKFSRPTNSCGRPLVFFKLLEVTT